MRRRSLFWLLLFSFLLVSGITIDASAATLDDFENGNLNTLLWWTHGDGNWAVSPTSAHSGNLAAASPSLSNNQQASLDLPLDCEAGNVSFWFSVSSEYSHGNFTFAIDDVEQGRWSGPVPWSQASFPVTPGIHVLSWKFSKDGSGSETGGGAFLDDVLVPAAVPPILTTAYPAGGTYTTAQNVYLSSNDTTATIYYTTDGSTPTTASATFYSTPVTIAATTTLRFFAVGNKGTEGVKSINYLFPRGDIGPVAFDPPVQTTLPYNAWGVATADFDLDSKADLAVANRDQNTVSVYRGNGNGTFSLAQEISVGSQPTSVAFAIINGFDSFLDVSVANSGSDSIQMLLGNGSGSFSSLDVYATGTGTRSVSFGHFNNDGPPDMAVTNYYSGYVNIYIGQGGGAFFNAPTGYYVGPAPMSVTIGKFNGDSNEDLAVVHESGTVSILTGNGAGNFSYAGGFSSPANARSISTGDLNGDGNSDLIVVSDGGDLPGGAGMLTLFQGNGDGTFQLPASFPQSQYTAAGTIADFNSDGIADVALVNRAAGILTMLYQSSSLGVPARSNQMVPIYYQSVQTALSDAQDGKVIEIAAREFHEDLTLTRDVNVTVKGGVSGSFGNSAGVTTIYGTVTIYTGTLIVDNLIIA
jgi:hypothetical protein